MTLRTLSLLALTGFLLSGCYVVGASAPPVVYGYGGYGYYERPHYRHYGPPVYRHYGPPVYRHHGPPAYGHHGRPHHHRHGRHGR